MVPLLSLLLWVTTALLRGNELPHPNVEFPEIITMNSIKKLSRVLAAPSKGGKKNRPNRVRRRRAFRVRRQPLRSRVPRGILAGYGSPVTASFFQSRSRDGEIVRGMDLVTSPYQPSQNECNISYFITANPASWNGTRIASVAAGYQNYRPLSFKIHYRPQVGSTSELSLTIGTVWQNTYITSRSAIEPSLVTSPGGTYLPAWQSSCSVVPLGRRLPQKMFPVRDPDFTTVPFSVVCRSAEGGTSSPSVPMPGRIFIEYVYEFRNAIGSGSGFQPARVDRRGFSVAKVFLPASETVVYPKAWQHNSNGPTVSSQYSGWCIDYEGEPSVAFPLFAKIGADIITGGTASTSQATEPSFNGSIALLEINGVQVPVANDEDVGTTRVGFVYDDDGLPE